MDRDFMNDILVVDEDLVDINYNIHGADNNKNNNKRYSDEKSFNKKDNNNNNNNKKKLIIIISSIAAAVIVALGITGLCVLNGTFPINDTPSEFVFSEGTLVSGVSISGKTIEEAKSLLEAKKESFIKPLSISVDVNGEITEITEKDFDYTYDIDTVLSSIKSDEQSSSAPNTAESKTYSITAAVTNESIDKNIKNIAEKYDKKAVNARVSKFTPYDKNRFEYEDAVAGCKVNTQDLSEQIKSVTASGAEKYRIVADVEKTQAKIGIEDLKNNIVKLSSYETVSYNTANGTSNMKVSLAACNGSVIEPGATWSFNDCTGNSNLESNGYKPAGVIENGKLTEGIGGGICQSSSTIYNAAVRANMDIEERHNHKWASSYVPTGLDATIDYGHLDLKMSNPTDYQMFLECKLVDSTLYVSFWGYKSPSYDEIRTHNEMTDKGSKSYTVKAWRVYFKDGKEVDRESLGSSTYDIENGYIFIEADNDSGAVDRNVDDINENPTSSSSSKPNSSSSPNSSSRPNSSSSVRPTEPKPTPAPPTEPEVPTDPPATDPIPSESNDESTLDN